MGLHETKRFWTVNVATESKKAASRKKIFIRYISDRGLISRLHEEFDPQKYKYCNH